MTPTTKQRDDAALSDAYEAAIRRRCEVLLDALQQDNADIDQACRYFKRGVATARMALELATKIVSE